MYERLYLLRRNNHLKQITIAKLLGIDASTYSKYERGQRKIPVEHLKKLAELYGTSMDYLSGYTDESDPHPRSAQDSNLSPHLSQHLLISDQKREIRR